MAVVLAFVLLLVSSGCSSPNQYFNSAELTEISNDWGSLSSGDAKVDYTVVASVDSSCNLVTFAAMERQRIQAACIIPFDKVLEFMPKTVDEALQVCSNPENGLMLNVNSATGDVVWPARADGLIYSLFMQIEKPGMVVDTELDLVSHFTFENGRLVPVNNRQIMAWFRGGASMPAEEPESLPRPRRARSTEPAVATPGEDGVIHTRMNTDPTPPPPAVEETPTASVPDRSLPASAPRPVEEPEAPAARPRRPSATEVDPDGFGGA